MEQWVCQEVPLDTIPFTHQDSLKEKKISNQIIWRNFKNMVKGKKKIETSHINIWSNEDCM